MQTSLVVQTSHLGDTILTTPLIARLAGVGPVVVVTTPAAAPVLANNPSIHALVIYDKRGRQRGLTGFLRASRATRRALAAASRATGAATPTIAYLAQGSVRSAMLAWSAGAATRVGFSTSAGRTLSTRIVDHRGDRHHAERLWTLADADLGSVARPTTAMLRPQIFPGPAERDAVSALLASAPGDAPLIVLAPGSKWGTKRWPHFPALARRLAEHARLAVVGDANDRHFAAAIVAEAGPRVIDATGRLSLLGTAELIGRAAAIVTNDSAPLHLASATGTPTVAIFGPTVPAFGFGPLAPASAIVQHEHMDCRPCDPHGPETCPLGHWRCMLELEADTVAGQTLFLLTASRV